MLMNINKCIRHLKVSTESKSLTSETLAKMSFIALKVVHCASCNMKYEQFKALSDLLLAGRLRS